MSAGRENTGGTGGGDLNHCGSSDDSHHGRYSHDSQDAQIRAAILREQADDEAHAERTTGEGYTYYRGRVEAFDFVLQLLDGDESDV